MIEYTNIMMCVHSTVCGHHHIILWAILNFVCPHNLASSVVKASCCLSSSSNKNVHFPGNKSMVIRYSNHGKSMVKKQGLSVNVRIQTTMLSNIKITKPYHGNRVYYHTAFDYKGNINISMVFNHGSLVFISCIFNYIILYHESMLKSRSRKSLNPDM